ncbi:hypothetical protein L596_030050 [Steinernema carpocapsae]|uniref:MH1 domain-containing protein n=1 Tax=Steinernema carpocapsae TaxID=34508 RepID=A0A4U5LRK0_STECR|nr:hypothetical protein L596_030050 [Steinernema carpocapsae]
MDLGLLFPASLPPNLFALHQAYMEGLKAAAPKQEPREDVKPDVTSLAVQEDAREAAPEPKKPKFWPSAAKQKLLELVNRLSQYCVVPVNDFERQALDGLLKRIHHNPEVVENLFKALDSRGVVVSPCIPFPRTRDGRIQIGHRKCFPAPTFIHLFRNANVTSAMVKPISPCVASDGEPSKMLSSTMFCANPYHYEVQENMAMKRKRAASRAPPRKVPKVVDPEPLSAVNEASIDLGDFYGHNLGLGNSSTSSEGTMLHTFDPSLFIGSPYLVPHFDFQRIRGLPGLPLLPFFEAQAPKM